MGTTASEPIPDAPPLEETLTTTKEKLAPLVPVALPRHDSPVTPIATDAVFVVNNTKKALTYWWKDDMGILPQGESSELLPLPIYIFPGITGFKPTSTPYFHLLDDKLYCDYVEGTLGRHHFHSVSANVIFTVEHLKDHYKVTVSPSALVA